MTGIEARVKTRRTNVDDVPHASARVVHVAFGSNVQPEANMVRALAALAGFVEVTALSPVFRTVPVDAEGAEFLNAVAAVTWPGALADLKDRLAAVESSQGRNQPPEEPDRHERKGTCPVGRPERWPARTIDLDIVLAGSLVARYGARPWEVPHPDILQFAHVAVPLAALVPGPHPATGRALADIAAELAVRTAQRPVDLKGWRHR